MNIELISAYMNVFGPRPSRSGKTSIWDVEAVSDSATLGEIRWLGRWRRYAFFPAVDTAFEHNCLRELADFCEEQTRAWRQSR